MNEGESQTPKGQTAKSASPDDARPDEGHRRGEFSRRFSRSLSKDQKYDPWRGVVWMRVSSILKHKWRHIEEFWGKGPILGITFFPESP